MVSFAVIITSIYFQIAARRRKRVMDAYNRELIALAKNARTAPSFAMLDRCNAELSEFVSRIVHDTERGRISSAEFALFNFAYDAVEDAIKDRQLQLEREERRQDGGSKAMAKTPGKRSTAAFEGSQPC
jgi:hypothetical protein